MQIKPTAGYIGYFELKVRKRYSDLLSTLSLSNIEKVKTKSKTNKRDIGSLIPAFQEKNPEITRQRGFLI